MKTPPHLYIMPSAASVISLPSWEQPLLTHGWENSSKEDERSHPQKLHRLTVQRLPLRASFPKQEHTVSSITNWISLRQTHRKAFSLHCQFSQYFYILSIRSCCFSLLKFIFNLQSYSLGPILVLISGEIKIATHQKIYNFRDLSVVIWYIHHLFSILNHLSSFSILWVPLFSSFANSFL